MLKSDHIKRRREVSVIEMDSIILHWVTIEREGSIAINQHGKRDWNALQRFIMEK